MQIAIRNIGNSKGVVIPKTMLAKAGRDGVASAEVSVESGSIVLRKPAKAVREGWAAAITAQGANPLLMGEFGNADDQGNAW